MYSNNPPPSGYRAMWSPCSSSRAFFSRLMPSPAGGSGTNTSDQHIPIPLQCSVPRYSYIDPLRYAWGALMINQFNSCCPGVFLGGQSVLECVWPLRLACVIAHPHHPQVLWSRWHQQVGLPGHPVLLFGVFLLHGVGWLDLCQAPKAMSCPYTVSFQRLPLSSVCHVSCCCGSVTPLTELILPKIICRCMPSHVGKLCE